MNTVRQAHLSILLALLLVLPLVAVGQARAVSPDVVISQVYGGGGNSGATYTHDFVELFNRGDSTVDISGWSVQYASATGTGSFGTNPVTVVNGPLAPGQRYLVQLAAGSGGTTPLPTPDAIGSINMSGTAGKVVLATTSAGLACNGGSTPCSAVQLAQIRDLVGYGGANFWEGSGPAPSLTNTLAAVRADHGCTDTDDNATDFTAGAVDPHNTGSPLFPCASGPVPGQPLPLTEDFDDCTLAGWQVVSVDPDAANTWSCSEDFSTIEANGFGDDAPADEWLITPPLDLDAQPRDTLSFRNQTAFTDDGYPQLSVLFSTDYDGAGDPTTATWTPLDGANYSPENSGSFVDSGPVDLSQISGARVHVAFRYVSTGTGGDSASRWRLDSISFTEAAAPSGLVINEVNADPDLVAGDANGDGTANFSDDEFVEIVNVSGADVDLGGWALSDAVGVRHTFPTGTVVADDCAVVVFGGGTATGTFGDATVQTASTGTVGLNNGGDTVVLSDGGVAVTSYAYGSEGGDNQSLTRDPDVTGTDPLVKHSTAAGSSGNLFSPGTRVDGSGFDGCQPVGPTYVHDVQGSGAVSPLAGRTVTVQGVVVGDFQDGAAGTDGDLNGFHLQEEDADADADPLTSEGVFVFDGSNPAVDVAVGDVVSVTGAVSEFNGMTEITPASVTIDSSGNPLPAVRVLTLPVAAVDDLEAVEGMYVTFPQDLVISEYFNFDRFNEVVLTSERHQTPTAEFEPGPAAVAAAEAFLRDRITLDDGRTISNPEVTRHPNGAPFSLTNRFRGGDTVADVTGVIDYSFDLYRIQPTAGATYTPRNTRTAAPDDVGGGATVASFNVLNYFTTLDYPTGDPRDNACGPAQNQECRGADADQPLELARQRDKILAALAAVDADVFGLIEIENHPADVPTADLVDGLNAIHGPGTYDHIATGAIGTDAIRVALIYKPGRVSPVGTHAVLDSSVDARFDDGKNRPALAQTFMDDGTGGVFTVAVNHLKSKGSNCNDVGDPDLGDGAGNCNVTRTNAVSALVDWLATDPTGSGDDDVLVIGDLNAYDLEDPIDELVDGGYTDLVRGFVGDDAYSYVFDGQTGYLDHALANTALVGEVSGTTVWHINADEPDLFDYDTSFKSNGQDAIYEDNAYRSSDHDPVIVGLDTCDEIAPAFDALSVSPEVLFPANHKYVDVRTTVRVSDNFDTSPTVRLVGVASNEPDNGVDDGNTTNDIRVVDDLHVRLRAERSGVGTGRIYTLTYEVADACGNTARATVTVTAPLSPP